MIEKNLMFYETCFNFFRKSFLENYNISYSEGMIYEDVLNTIKSYIYASKVKYIDSKLYTRRIRNGSIMTTEKTEKNIVGHFNCANYIYKLQERKLGKRTKTNLLVCISKFYIKCLIDSYNLKHYDWIEKISKSIKVKNIKNIELDILCDSVQLYINFSK